MKETYWSGNVFRAASIILKWEQHQYIQSSINYFESHLRQSLFRKKDFFRTSTWLEQVVLSNNYIFVTNAFTGQRLLKGKYFFRTATASKELLLQKKQLFKTCMYLFEAVGFSSSYFFRRSIFLEAGISWDQSLFLKS